MAFRDYIHVTHIPPGLILQHRANAPEGWEQGIAKGQSTNQSHRNTTVRPKIATVYDYDEDGEITDVANAADEWIIAGDWSDETWADEDEMTEDIAQVMCDYLHIPEQQQPAIKATMNAVILTWEQVKVLAAEWDVL